MSNAADLLIGCPINIRRGVTLHACHVPGDAPPLVFLHGGLGNRYNWRSQYEFAVAHGWEALAYDLAGHGQSNPYHRYSVGRHCRDLTRLLHQFQIQRPILCCHSYGVPIGLEWARHHSTTALILIAGGTHDLAPWWEIPLMKALKWGGRYAYQLPLVQRLTQKLSTAHDETKLDRFFAESPVPSEFHPYEALEIFWRYNFFARRSAKQHLQGLPILIMSGGQDPMFTAAMGSELAAYFSNAQHLHLADAGHLMLAECPDRVNGAIAQFIRQLSDAP
ncbi:MAG: alpha/beta hydrolase [Elainellaceae cyanobacterium]